MFSETFLPQVNGVVTSICTMGNALAGRGHEIKVFTSGGGLRRTAHERVGRFDVYRLGGFNFRPYPGYKVPLPTSGKWVFLLKNAGDLDVLHTRGPVAMGLLAKRLSQKLRIPIVGTFDTPLSQYVKHYIPLAGRVKPSRYLLSKLADRYSIWFYNRCSAVVAPSGVTAGWLRRMGCRKEIRVISNGVDIKKYSTRNRSAAVRNRFCPGDEFFILHVGRIAKEKNVDVLLRAACSLKKSGARFRLVVAGEGPAKSGLAGLAKRLGLDDCVVFAGFVGEDELPKYYASADAFVTASTVETEGIVLLEAMASGLPVVGANAGAIPELVKHGENGLLFGPGGHETLSTLLETAMNDAKLRRGMGRSSRELAEGYSIEKSAEKTEKLYKDVV
jgi:glycosyltransferase involved in cell wall biosynthesis